MEGVGQKVSWADDEIAGPMGYTHCVGFDCARDALRAWPHGVALPKNVCRSVYEARPDASLEEVDQTTGLAKYTPAHLYGYQSPAGVGFKLTLDPLMTGWVRRLKTESAIISFGRKKMLSLGYGGAFLTRDQALAEEMKQRGGWNETYTPHMIRAFDGLADDLDARWEVVDLWDRYLGDCLIRIPQEQLMPWRVMRRAWTPFQRFHIVGALREYGYDVGTNYPPLEGRNEWGDTVLNFFCPPSMEKIEIERATDIVKGAVGHTHG